MSKVLVSKDVRSALVLQGILTVIFGVAAVFWPGLTALTLLYLFGAYLLVAGIVHVVHGVSSVNKATWWFLTALLGVVELGFGVYLLRHPGVAFSTLLLIIGWVLVIKGVIEVVTTLFENNGDMTTRTLNVLAGLVALVVGIVVLAQKASAGLAFVWILGIYAIVVGTMQLAAARNLETDNK